MEKEKTIKKERKKWSKKKIWLVVIASVLSLLLIAGLLIYIFIFNSPLYKVYQAALKTKEHLDDILQNADQLSAWVDSVKQTYESGQFELDMTYSKETPNIELSLRHNREQTALAGEMTYHFKNSKSIDADFSANGNELMFRFPELLDKTFSVPLNNLGDETANNSYFSEYLPDWVQALDGLDPELFTDVSWEAYQKAHEEQIDELTDSLDAEEVDSQIPHTTNLTTYRMRLNTQLFTELFLGYLHYVQDTRVGEDYDTSLNDSIEWFEELLLGKELTFWFGVNEDDCLTAFHLEAQAPEDSSTVTIVLSGEENPWNEFSLWIDGELEYDGGLYKQASGFALEVNDRVLVCNDDARTLTLLHNGETTMNLHYLLQNGRSSAELSYGSTQWTLGLAPYHGTVVMLSDAPTELFRMGLFEWLEVVAALAKEGLIKLW